MLQGLNGANVTVFKWRKCYSAFFAQINTDSKYPLMLVETEVSPAQRFSSAIKLLCNLMRANVTVPFLRKYGRSCNVIAEATRLHNGYADRHRSLRDRRQSHQQDKCRERSRIHQFLQGR